jgi:hypothetical protein
MRKVYHPILHLKSGRITMTTAAAAVVVDGMMPPSHSRKPSSCRRVEGVGDSSLWREQQASGGGISNKSGGRKKSKTEDNEILGPPYAVFDTITHITAKPMCSLLLANSLQ